MREIGAASTVLLKNAGDALPLRTPKSVAIIGVSSVAHFPATSPNLAPPVGSIPDFAPAWAAAKAKAKTLVAAFTLEQKVNVSTGAGWQGGRCVGNIPAIGDWPGLRPEDSPLGVRFTDFGRGRRRSTLETF